ncbi:MAG: hypothetical protein Q4B47_06815, partial [Eubacteriales bacterium]|nr:hypothetical protein [Eubacteriales bacterium]
MSKNKVRTELKKVTAFFLSVALVMQCNLPTIAEDYAPTQVTESAQEEAIAAQEAEAAARAAAEA